MFILLLELWVFHIFWGASPFPPHTISFLVSINAHAWAHHIPHSPFWKLFISCPSSWFKVHSFKRVRPDSPSRVKLMPLGLSHERTCALAEWLWLLLVWSCPCPSYISSFILLKVLFSWLLLDWLQNLFWLACVFFSEGLQVLFLSSGLGQGYLYVLTNNEPLFCAAVTELKDSCSLEEKLWQP